MAVAPQTKPSIGWGGQIWLENDVATPVYVRLAKVMGELKVPSIEADEVEVTTFDSVDRYREFISGLKDGGSGTFELVHIDGSATDVLLRTAATNATVRKVKILLPNEVGVPATQYEMSCFVKNYAPTAPLDGVMMAEVELRYSGAVTRTPL
jgi:predicted secreted protein